MAFLIDINNPNAEVPMDAWLRYYEYLQSNCAKLPSSTYQFATAEWHYDPSDPRSLHDAVVQMVTLLEVQPSKEAPVCQLKLEIRLTNAYSSGTIVLNYENIRTFSIQTENQRLEEFNYWQYDEITLSREDLIKHEISFTRAYWIIECSTVEYEFVPTPSEYINIMIHRDKAYIPSTAEMMIDGDAAVTIVDLTDEAAIGHLENVLLRLYYQRGKIGQLMNILPGVADLASSGGLASSALVYRIELGTFEYRLHIGFLDDAGNFVQKANQIHVFSTRTSPYEFARAIIQAYETGSHMG